MAFWADLIGTTAAYIRIGLSGVRLKNVTGNLAVRNAGDSADAEVTASKVNISGEELVLNSDAAGSSADWTYTIARPTSGMTAAVTLTLPTTNGSPSQFLQTDGDGNLTFADGGDTAPAVKMETTALAFGTSSPVTMFTLPADNLVEKIQVYVDTAFDGTAPTMSVGYSGQTSAYMPSTAVDLKTTGMYEYHPLVAIDNSTVDLIITYSADSSAAGAARVVVFYGEPA